MTSVDEGREKDFAAIKDSIPPEFDDPSENQQCAVNDLDKELCDQYGSEEEKDEEGNGRGPTKAAIVLAIVRTKYNRLFLDEYQVPHAAVTINDHLEIMPLRSKRFRSWIAGTVYRESQTVMDSQTIKDIIGVLNAEAEFNNEEPIKLDLRVGDRYVNNESRWYYDLTNKNWEFIEITSDYWKQVNNLIVFRRFPNQTPQVYPCSEYPGDIFDRFMDLLRANKMACSDCISFNKDSPR